MSTQPPAGPGQPMYPGQPTQQSYPGYTNQPAYVGQPGYAGQPTYVGQPGYTSQPGYPQSGLPQPVNKRPLWPWLLGGSIAVVLVCCIILMFASSASKGSKTYAVTYKVTVSAPAEVSYSNNGTSSEKIERGEWSTKVTVKGSGYGRVSVHVTPQEYDEENFESTCEILIDGKSVSKNSSSSRTGASCSGDAI